MGDLLNRFYCTSCILFNTSVCEPPAAIVNGATTLSEGGRIANFSCDTGYELVGSEIRVCLYDGTGWNGTQARCGK